MKILYEIRFVIYQYNGGGQIYPGNQLFKEKFSDIKTAKKFSNKIIEWITKPETRNTGCIEQIDNYQAFINRYVWDGYLVKFDGIYKMTEEKLE